jgi:hypothetical protein
MQALGLYLLERWNLPQKFGMDRFKIRNFLSYVEMSYSTDIDYHTATHAADVLHAVHFLLSTANLASFLSDMEVR